MADNEIETITAAEVEAEPLISAIRELTEIENLLPLLCEACMCQRGHRFVMCDGKYEIYACIVCGSEKYYAI